MNKRLNTILLILATLIGIVMPAAASYLPFNTNVNMNVGIGTTTPEGALTVMNGNVGIGTWVPGYALQVQGVGEFAKAVYATNILSGASGFTLNVSGGGVSAGGGITYVGATAPIAPGTLEFLTGTAVGTEPERMRIDANGNVGIGSWGQNNLVNTFSVVGNIGIGTNQSSPFVQTSAPNGGIIIQNNVGIGSLTPGQALDVNGTIRMTGITLTGNGAANGNVLVGNSVGVGTWMPANTLSTSAAGTNYWLLNGGAGNIGINTSYAVGIGTSFVGGTNEAALSVMNGNVGIGTWVPKYGLDIIGNVGIGTKASGDAFIVTTSGVGIGTFSPADNFQVFSNDAGGTEATIGSVNNIAALCIDGIHGNCIGSDYLQLDQLGNGQMDIYYLGNGTGDLSFRDNSGNIKISFKQGGNVGIGTSSPVSLLGILGNVAIGKTAGDAFLTTTAPSGGMIVEGNIGVGSTAPGTALDVNGTARVSGFTLTGNGAANGNVLVGNSIGVGTWMPASTLSTSAAGTNYWLLNGGAGNVGINTSYAVGIGTSFVGGTGEASLSVMNGNVGIGTWVPGSALAVAGNVAVNAITFPNTIGGVPKITSAITGIFEPYLVLSSDAGSDPSLSFQRGNTAQMQIVSSQGGPQLISYFGGFSLSGTGNVGIGTILGSGNLGVGSTAPGQLLDVQGTARMIGFTLTGNGAANGNVLVTNSVGVGTWMPASSLASTNYWNYTAAGNIGVSTIQAVGIGTSFIGGTGEAALSIMNGKVGIGTWLPAGVLDIPSKLTVVLGTGNQSSVTIGGNNTQVANPTQLVFGDWQNAGTTRPEYVFNGTLDWMGLGQIDSASDNNLRMGSNGTNYYNTWPAYGSFPFNLSIDGGVGIGTFVMPTKNGLLVQGNVGIGTIDYGASLGIVGNVGIGTIARGDLYLTTAPPNGGMIVEGNIGIGSFAPVQKLDVQGTVRDLGEIVNGNIGVGSAAPGTALDVNGTARVGGFTLTGNGAANGNVLVGNSVGVGTWMPANTLATSAAGTNYWLLNGGAGNVGINTSYAVGIGTSFVGGTGESALSVMNGNVGIGTWLPNSALIVMNGNVGIGTLVANYPLQVVNSNGLPAIFGYNTTGFGYGVEGISDTGVGVDAISNGASGQDYALMARQYGSGSAAYFLGGATATTPTVIIQQATGSLADLLQAQNSAGTSLVNITSAGNVGIGTWTPIVPLQIVGVGTQTPYGGGVIINNGNVGIGTTVPGSALFVGSGVITSYNTLATSGEGIVTYAGNGKAINMQAGTANANILYDSTGGFSFQSEARNLVLAGLSSSTNITMNIDANGNVGIGTTGVLFGGLVVQNGNVGFGTYFPQTGLAVMNGNVGIGTWTAKGGNLIVNGGGNVGIGSAWPGTMLDVQGTIRSLGQVTNGNVTVASGGQFSGRITRRLVAVTQSATPSINTDTMDIASITGLAQAITSMSSGLTGTPVNGDMLMIQITDNGTARGITWGASFASTTVNLPTTTVASTMIRILLQYNSATSHWECLAVA